MAAIRTVRPLVMSIALAAWLGTAGVAHGALKAPSLQSPADTARVQSVPVFSWGAVKSADRYEFQLAADRNFGSIVEGRGTGSFQTKSTAGSIKKSIADGTYWWRVRGITLKGKAGTWSRVRTIEKRWSTAPQLLSPTEGAAVTFPSVPLVLRWTTVARAYKYRVFIATDPELGSLVTGTASKPIESDGPVYAAGANLPPGRYYWAIQPVDSAGHAGTRSAVGSFTWSWPSATATSYQDLVDDQRLADPRVSWDPIPGAVGYEVEINHSDDFATGSKVCCDQAITGTAFAPKTIVPNNVYHWRVRGIDPDGNSGQWNRGPDFDKNFGNIPPTIQNLRVIDNESDPAVDQTPITTVLDTGVPIITWDPVPGAADYVVALFPTNQFGCDLTNVVWETETAANAWTPLVRKGNVSNPIPVPSNVAISTDAPLVPGASYCVDVYARSGDKSVRSDVTQLGGPGTIAFRYDPAAPVDVVDPISMTADKYLAPVQGSANARLPIFKWKPVTGAASYWVFVSRDDEFTTLVDVALTRIPAYAPRAGDVPRTYRDEDTPYYWAILPAHEADGGGVNFGPAQNAPRSFSKRSVPPALLSPANGADVGDQPVFRWTSGDAAIGVPEGAKSYRLEVAQDPSFGNLIDEVTTQATSYTADEVYPADTVLYWRVRVTDAKDIGLAWSATGSFRRRLQMPPLAADNPVTGSVIQVVKWLPVQGAASYDIHVDQADGTRKDFNVRGTAFTPTTWYGTGIWRWQVRANFPKGNSKVASAYTPLQGIATRIPAPEGVRSQRDSRRVILSWEPVFNAKNYKVEFSATNSFSTVAQGITTENLAVTADLSKAPFVDGGQIFWRIAAVDEGGNVGGYAAGEVRTARRMTLKAAGGLARRVKGKVVVTVLDADGDPLRNVKIRVSGAAQARAKRTSKRGTATFRLRPRRRGTVTFRAARTGYKPAEAQIVVR